MSNDNLALTPSGLRSFNKWHAILSLLLLALLFVLPWVFNIGPNSWKTDCAPKPVAAAPAPAPVVAAPAAVVAPPPPPAPAPALPPPPPAAKVYFGSDKFAMPATAAATPR